jgi:sugar phosphate permease
MTTLQHAEAPTASLASGRRWFVAGILLLVVISGFFDRISIAVLFTNHDFNTAIGTNNPALLGLLMTSFLFAYGASGVALSFVGDIIGVRRSLAIASTIWGVLMALMGAASSYALMIFYRVLLGVAEGPQFSFVNKLVKQWFPPHEQARANSIWMIGSPLGSAIGFPLTIALIANFGWRASFYVLAMFNIAIMVPLILAFIYDRPQQAARAPQTVNRPTAQSFKSDVGHFLSDWRFWLILIFNSACLLYLWGFNAWLPTYLQTVRHFELKSLGIFASLPFILMFFGELASGYISDRLGRRAVVCFVGLFCAGALIYLVPMVANPYLAAIVMALSAGFWGAALPPLFALAANIIPPSVTSSGVGVYNGVGNLVGACSPLLMGWIIGVAGNFNAGLMVLVFSGVIGACAMLPLLKRY